MVRVRSGESGKAERSPGSEIVPGSIVTCGVPGTRCVPGSVLAASGPPDGGWRHQTPVNPGVTLGLTRSLYFRTKPQRNEIRKFILFLKYLIGVVFI